MKNFSLELHINIILQLVILVKIKVIIIEINIICLKTFQKTILVSKYLQLI